MSAYVLLRERGKQSPSDSGIRDPGEKIETPKCRGNTSEPSWVAYGVSHTSIWVQSPFPSGFHCDLPHNSDVEVHTSVGYAQPTVCLYSIEIHGSDHMKVSNS